VLGLNFLVSNQVDLAIEELTRAARLDSEAVEVDLILGNLYREKGQVGRAIQVHQALLQRPKLKRIEHAYALLCLGLDFKRGGFVDRAFEAFTEVLRLDPQNYYAWSTRRSCTRSSISGRRPARSASPASLAGRRDRSNQGVLRSRERVGQQALKG
jgi:tetratricopeptide (TPR) repeat protein